VAPIGVLDDKLFLGERLEHLADILASRLQGLQVVFRLVKLLLLGDGRFANCSNKKTLGSAHPHTQ
jgi:hypothetical protein